MSLYISPSAPPDNRDRFDPFSPEYLADPYPMLTDARETAPVFYAADLDHWVVTRYAEIRSILRTPSKFSAINAIDPMVALCPQATRELRDGGYAAVPALVNLDPPGHAQQRRLANSAFTPKRIAALEPMIRKMTRRFCDERLQDGKADIIADLAWALPALVLFRILGLPDSDLVRVKEGSRHRAMVIFGRASEEEQVSAAQQLAAFWRYAARLIETRIENPGDDFISALVCACDDNGGSFKLTPRDLTSIMVQVLFAGHETTTNLIGNVFRRLLQDRSSWEAICRDPDLIPNAVEEILRFDSPAIAWRQKTRVAADIGGVVVPADAKLLLLLGAANRDPAVFQEPDRFDIRRANAHDHLSFGQGPHICLGAPLARLETRVVLQEISRRFPSLRLAPNTTLGFVANITLRGPRSLPVVW